MKRVSVIGWLNSISPSSSSIVQYDSMNGSLVVYSLDDDEVVDDSEQHVFYQDVKVVDDRVEYKDIFERTFGKYERTRPVAVKASLTFRKVEDYSNYASYVGYSSSIFQSNYFYSALNAPYMDLTCVVFSNISYRPKTELIEHKRRKFYNELSLEYDAIKDDKS